MARVCGGNHSWQSAQALERLLKKDHTLRVFSVTRARQPGLEGQQVVRAEPDINLSQVVETLNPQSSANQQDERQSYFGYDQHVLQPPLRNPCTWSTLL